MENNTYTFTTANGAAIKFAVATDHIAEKVTDADGNKITVKTNEWSYNLNSLTVNGEARNGKFDFYNNQRVINLGDKMVNGKSCPILVAIPETIVNEIFGAEKAEATERNERMAVAEKAYEAHCEMMAKAMSK